MKLFITILVLFLSFNSIAQDSGKHGVIKVRKNIPVEDYIDIDFIPEYNYGILQEVIAGSIKYPQTALNEGIEGVVKVLVVIDTNGEIVWSQIQKGINSELDKEAKRVIKLLATFKPVKKDNVFVNIRTVIPVVFKIE